jgi:hypothetical protein
LLAVLSLQASVTWGHQHSSDSADLAEHIARYHSHDSHAWDLGLHWHFTLPGTAGESPEHQESPQQLLPCLVSHEVIDLHGDQQARSGWLELSFHGTATCAGNGFMPWSRWKYSPPVSNWGGTTSHVLLGHLVC